MTDQLEPLKEIQDREREFWNNRANESPSLDPQMYRVTPTHLHDPAMPWLPYMGVTVMVRRLFDGLGDLRGKRVLDVAAGTGFLSVALALRGAEVVSTDIAERPLEIGRFRAQVSGVSERIEFRRVPSESLEFPDETFDAVVGLFCLHHLDLTRATPEIWRVLKPAGKGAFLETSGRNKLLMAARSTLRGRFGIDKAGSDDEVPLNAHAEANLRDVFGDGIRFLYPDLVFFRMLAANVGLFRFQPMMWLLKITDNTMWNLHILRSWSYFTLVELEKSKPRS